MRFRQKNNPSKTILVISDLHLSAGMHFGHKKNFLEDFHSDRELVDFLHYFCSGNYTEQEVELIINGDFLDFLAVPYVRYFDDEFWSEEAAIEKITMIVEAHREVFNAMEKFLRGSKKKIVYIIGNHDAEMALEGPRNYFMSLFSDSVKNSIQILLNVNGEYYPEEGIVVKHGHEYEAAHHFHPQESVIQDDQFE